MSPKRILGRAALALLMALGAVTAGTASAPAIVGGTPATTPWAVSLQSITESGAGYHECGGVLIAPQWVLTASHCAPYVKGLARVGSLSWNKGGELVAVEAVISHPGDNPKNFRDDIALVRLARPVGARPFPLGIAGGTGTTSLVAGWGTTCDEDINDPVCHEMTPDNLQQLGLRRVSGDECALTSPQTGENLFWEPGMTCLVSASGLPQGWCFGDSGSPIMERQLGVWKAVGIAIADMDSTTAHPHLCSTGPGGTVNHGAATKIGPYLPWINDTMAAYR